MRIRDIELEGTSGRSHLVQPPARERIIPIPDKCIISPIPKSTQATSSHNRSQARWLRVAKLARRMHLTNPLRQVLRYLAAVARGAVRSVFTAEGTALRGH